MYRIPAATLLVFSACMAHAQMPHELLLLVNRSSQDSMRVANHFAAARQIPFKNVVRLELPESAYDGTATVTPEEFTRLVWEPANAIARERGIDGQILAWIYSTDFPIRIRTDANDRRQMSICGLTFLRNQVPGLELVEEGKYLSRLFAGPNQRLQLTLGSLSLGMQKQGLGMDAQVPRDAEWLRFGLGERMPLPSMMLGYTGENGTDVQTVLDTIARGVRSDHRGARKGIYFVVSDDVRSTCREWQYYPCVNELSQRGITAVATTNFPVGANSVMGLLMGADSVDPATIASFAPGAMAEHLTSWGAEFQKPQTKVTEWLKAGATATAGTVVEPYSNPDKFPSARFFAHYASGCTMLESFYQSIACPLQTLPLGEPLAKPYALPISANILGADAMKGDFTYMAKAECRIPNVNFLYSFLLDGKEIQSASSGNSIYLRHADLSAGYHELRVVARVVHSVQFNITVEKGIMVERMGRSATLLPEVVRLGAHEHALRVRIGGQEMPRRIKLVCGEVVLDDKPFVSDAELVLDEMMVGEGPNLIRAVAVYEDGMEVSSAPVPIEISFPEPH